MRVRFFALDIASARTPLQEQRVGVGLIESGKNAAGGVRFAVRPLRVEQIGCFVWLLQQSDADTAVYASALSLTLPSMSGPAANTMARLQN